MGEELYRSQSEVIEGAIRFVSHRYRLAGAEAEDFASEARLKFIENDYAVLRSFQQRSSMRTFLVAVVQRVYLDHRARVWGKWRPSTKAKKMGEVAVKLERLLSRDGLSFDEAVETLRTNHHVAVDASELEEIRSRLPHRLPRLFVGEEVLETLPAERGSDGETVAARVDRDSLIHAASAAVDAALSQMNPQDRLLIKLRFYDGLTIAQIARLQHVEQKPLYRRLERSLAALRDALNTAGFRRDEITEILRQEDMVCD